MLVAVRYSDRHLTSHFSTHRFGTAEADKLRSPASAHVVGRGEASVSHAMRRGDLALRSGQQLAFKVESLLPVLRLSDRETRKGLASGKSKIDMVFECRHVQIHSVQRRNNDITGLLDI